MGKPPGPGLRRERDWHPRGHRARAFGSGEGVSPAAWIGKPEASPHLELSPLLTQEHIPPLHFCSCPPCPQHALRPVDPKLFLLLLPPPPPPPVPVQGVGVWWFPLTFAAGRSQIASAHGQFSELPLGPAPVLFAQEAWRWSFPKCPLGSNHPSGGGKPQVAIPALLRISLMSFCTILNLHASVSSPVPWREQHLPWAVVGLG